MFYYWPRAFVNERLRLAVRQSYRLVPATPSGRIRSDGVVALLSRARVGIDAPLTDIPHDLLTPAETVARFSESGVTLRDLRRWTRRRRNCAPHFRLNSHTIRFSAGCLDAWLAQNSLARKNRRTA